MPLAGTRHLIFTWALHMNGSRPSAIYGRVTNKYNSHHWTNRSHSTWATETIISADKGHIIAFATVNLNVIVGIVVRKNAATIDHSKVEQNICFGVGGAEHLSGVLQVGVCAVDCISIVTAERLLCKVAETDSRNRCIPNTGNILVAKELDRHNIGRRIYCARSGLATVIYAPQSCSSAFAVVNQNPVVVAVLGQSRKIEHQPCIGIGSTEHLPCILQVAVLGISFVYHIACATSDIGRRGYHFGANRRNACAPRTATVIVATKQNREFVRRRIQNNSRIPIITSHTRTSAEVATIYLDIVVASIVWQ